MLSSPGAAFRAQPRPASTSVSGNLWTRGVFSGLHPARQEDEAKHDVKNVIGRVQAYRPNLPLAIQQRIAQQEAEYAECQVRRAEAEAERPRSGRREEPDIEGDGARCEVQQVVVRIDLAAPH